MDYLLIHTGFIFWSKLILKPTFQLLWFKLSLSLVPLKYFCPQALFTSPPTKILFLLCPKALILLRLNHLPFNRQFSPTPIASSRSTSSQFLGTSWGPLLLSHLHCPICNHSADHFLLLCCNSSDISHIQMATERHSLLFSVSIHGGKITVSLLPQEKDLRH